MKMPLDLASSGPVTKNLIQISNPDSVINAATETEEWIVVNRQKSRENNKKIDQSIKRQEYYWQSREKLWGHY